MNSMQLVEVLHQKIERSAFWKRLRVLTQLLSRLWALLSRIGAVNEVKQLCLYYPVSLHAWMLVLLYACMDEKSIDHGQQQFLTIIYTRSNTYVVYRSWYWVCFKAVYVNWCHANLYNYTISIIISPVSSCAMTGTATRVASTFAVLFLGVLLTVVPCIVAHAFVMEKQTINYVLLSVRTFAHVYTVLAA